MQKKSLCCVCLSTILLIHGADAVELARSDESEKTAPLTSDDKTPEGHSYHGEAFNEGPRQAAYLMKSTGNVSFPVKSHNRLVQQFIDQGVGQLHGFWYLEAERSFRQAAALDSNCAAAYWGMAMANANNKDRAKKFSKEAVNRRDNETDRVRRYIDALDKKLNAKDKKVGFEKYVKDLEQIVYEYPDDIDAKAFIALELWQGRSSSVKITSHLAVDALIGDVLAVNPMHPVHHYRIHLWDYEKPERALKSAALCGQSAPSIAHMWHMPGHIYSRLKRYEDAAWQQEASARTDHAHMMRDQLLPDQIHNFAHNNEWLIRNLLFVGRIHDALDLAKNMIELPRHPKLNLVSKSNSSSNYGRTRLFQVLSQGELWEELIKLADTPYLEPTDDFAEQVKRLRYVGRAHGWLGKLDALANVRADLQSLSDKTNTEKEEAVTKAEHEAEAEYDKKLAADKSSTDKDSGEGDNAKSSSDEQSKKDPDAADAAKDPSEEEGTAKPQADEPEENTAGEPTVDKKKQQAIEKARKKVVDDFDRKQGRIKKAMDELDAHVKMAGGDKKEALKLFKSAGAIDKWHLARFRHQAGESDEAIKELEDYIENHKGEALPLSYLTEIAWQAKKKEAAKRSFEKLRDISSSIDLASPPFARLAPIAADLGYADTDWRKESTLADDIGIRPPLDNLGPFRWRPPAAYDWTLQSSEGNFVSASDYEGKPVIAIFYLGFGCLHCAEQLQAFSPRVETFREAGIELIAISSDNAEDLKKSVEAFGGVFPIRLVSDSELDIFKSYRAFDDFENQPLHGTFLIDGKGLIRWQDTGHEPFMDHEFLLKEAQRLLAIDP